MKTHQLFEIDISEGLTREEKKEVRKRMIELIFHGFPNELSSGHEGQWFVLNTRNQAVWNWRNRDYPFRLLIKKEFPHLFERWKNWRPAEQYAFSNSVLNSKEVKQFKTDLRDKSDEVVLGNVWNEVKQIDHEIARLQARKEQLAPQYKRARRLQIAQKRQRERP